jgi:hypothetical protein
LEVKTGNQRVVGQTLDSHSGQECSNAAMGELALFTQPLNFTLADNVVFARSAAPIRLGTATSRESVQPRLRFESHWRFDSDTSGL